MLELALGLCLFYIAPSLLRSGLTQYLSEWRQWRGRILVGMLKDLVNHDGHEGESILTALLEDARISGGHAGTKAKDKTNPDKPPLLLPAGGRIDKFVFTDALLDLITATFMRSSTAAAAPPTAGSDAGTVPLEDTVQLVKRLEAAINSFSIAITVSLSGGDLSRWDEVLKNLQPEIDALKGLPLDEVSRRAESILKVLQVAATAEGLKELRARLDRMEALLARSERP